MQFFQFRATDSQGVVKQGTIQANTSDEARNTLARTGLTVHDVRPVGAPSAQPQPRPRPQPQAQPRPQPQAQPRPQPQAARPVQRQAPAPSPGQPMRINPVSNPVKPVVRTIQGTYKHRFFLFSQLGAAMHAGLNPAQVLNEMAMRGPMAYRASLAEAAVAATEGIPLSTVFARYPDLYPPDITGMMAAGEAAGFVPEALNEIANQQERAHQFQRFFFWVWFVIANALLTIPGIWIFCKGLLKGADSIIKSGGQGANGESGIGYGLREITRGFGSALLWPWGPITLLVYAALYFAWRYLGSRVGMRSRHRLGLIWPAFGKRARNENLTRFSWVMSRVSRAGIAPAKAWQLSAASVPNLIMRENLMAAGAHLQGAERLSEILARTKVFPEEYVPVVSSAEYIGDVPAAMERLANMSNGEFVAAQNVAKLRGGCWGLLALMVTGGIAMAVFYYVWLYELPKKFGDPDT